MDLNNLNKKQKVILITTILSVVLIFGYYYYKSPKENTADKAESVVVSDEETNADGKGFKYIEITGQVVSPGVYQVKKEMMVIELVELAGGLTEHADLEAVHKDLPLSSLVENRQKVYIPALSKFSNSGSFSNNKTDNAKVSINSASIDELDSLPGIGTSTANKIIEARPYNKIEDLMDIEGIGEKTFEEMVSQLSL